LNTTLILATILALWLTASTAHALINARFTPVHLVKESTLIVWLDFKAGLNSVFTASIRETLKGKTEQKRLGLDGSSADEDTANALRDLVAAGQQEGITRARQMTGK